MLGGTPLEPKPDQGLVEFGVPCSWGLPEPVKCLDEVEHLVLMAPEDEARGLLDVDFFLQHTIQECRLDVHVMDSPAFRTRRARATAAWTLGEPCERRLHRN